MQTVTEDFQLEHTVPVNMQKQLHECINLRLALIVMVIQRTLS